MNNRVFLTFIQILLKDERCRIFLIVFERYVIVLEKLSGLAWFKLVNWRLHAKEREAIRLKPKP